jgi:hypothetical protein
MTGATLDDAFIIANAAPNFPLVRVAPDPRASVGGVVFNDLDGNGQLDSGEGPLPGRAVFIDVNHNGQRDATEGVQYTSTAGQYRFGGLVAGDYAVRQVVPADWQQTTSPADISLTSGQSLTNVNLGSAPVDVEAIHLLRFRDRLDHSPHDLEYRFDDDIVPVDSAMFQLTTAAGGSTPIPPSAIETNNDWNRVTIRLDQLNLADGNYALDISANAIADTSNNALADPIHNEFFILTADANHDRYVNSLDFTALAANFNKSSGVSFSGGDFNYDGRVNALDFNALASRFGTYLAPAAGSSVVLAALQSAAPMRDLFGGNAISSHKLDVLEN